MACYAQAETAAEERPAEEKSTRLDCDQSRGETSTRLDSGRQEASRPPVQIHIHQCPDCQQATVQTSKGEVAIGAAELEQARCDCQIGKPGERNKTSIPPAIRRLVLARDRHRCQWPGCTHTRHLELHHIVPRSKGGGNEAENLTTLCSACHKVLHERKLAQTGYFVKSPKAGYQIGKFKLAQEVCPPAGYSLTT